MILLMTSHMISYVTGLCVPHLPLPQQSQPPLPKTFNLVSDSDKYFNYFKYISFFPAKQAMRVDMLYTNKLNICLNIPWHSG